MVIFICPRFCNTLKLINCGYFDTHYSMRITYLHSLKYKKSEVILNEQW
jgi:hypothetical protein